MEGRFEFDLEAWSAAASRADTQPIEGAALTASAAIGVATGLALISMSFRADVGEAVVAEVYRAARAEELDDLRGVVLEHLAAESAPDVAATDEKQASLALERAFETLEAALRGLRLAGAGRAGVAADSVREWRSGIRLLGAAAHAAEQAVGRRCGHLENAECDDMGKLAGVLVQEADRRVGESSAT